MSDGIFINFKSQNWSITFLPKPSMLNASFEAICFNFSLAVKLQSYPFKQRLTASSLLVELLISFFVTEPHRHFSGKIYLILYFPLFVISTETT